MYNIRSHSIYFNVIVFKFHNKYHTITTHLVLLFLTNINSVCSVSLINYQA